MAIERREHTHKSLLEIARLMRTGIKKEMAKSSHERAETCYEGVLGPLTEPEANAILSDLQTIPK